MLDIGFLEQVLLDGALAGRVEDLFLDDRVHGQLGCDLQHQLLLALGALGVLVGRKQLLDLAVIGFQERDGVHVFGFGGGHDGDPSLVKTPHLCVGEGNLGSVAQFLANDSHHLKSAGRRKLSGQGTRATAHVPIRRYARPLVGILLYGTSLSTRMSPGRPSTRSAMMLRKISSVPPAIRIEGEDSSICWNWPCTVSSSIPVRTPATPWRSMA